MSRPSLSNRVAELQAREFSSDLLRRMALCVMNKTQSISRSSSNYNNISHRWTATTRTHPHTSALLIHGNYTPRSRYVHTCLERRRKWRMWAWAWARALLLMCQVYTDTHLQLLLSCSCAFSSSFGATCDLVTALMLLLLLLLCRRTAGDNDDVSHCLLLLPPQGAVSSEGRLSVLLSYSDNCLLFGDYV